MQQRVKYKPTSLRVNQAYEGESIEVKMSRLLENKDGIKGGSERIFTERKEGVHPALDIRTDRWDLATEKMDAVSRNRLAKREDKHDLSGKRAQERLKREADKNSGSTNQDSTEANTSDSK